MATEKTKTQMGNPDKFLMRDFEITGADGKPIDMTPAKPAKKPKAPPAKKSELSFRDILGNK